MLPSGFNPDWIRKLPSGRPGLGPSLDELQNFRLTPSDAQGIIKEKEDWLKFRYLCQTSLRFLVNCVLRPNSSKFLSLKEKVHGQIFDSYLQPIPVRYADGNAIPNAIPWDQWSDIKERVTLAFRGALKSTIHGGFLTQVILCDPDVRILVLSGKLKHSQTILSTARQPFCTNEVIRTLFPETRINEADNHGDSFVARTRSADLNLRDPTLSIGTFESVKAGGHYEFLMFDDCTNEINCATPELVDKNEQRYDDTEGLIEPGGYRHFLGTRWAPDDTDLPEVIRQRGEAYATEHDGQQNTQYVFVPVWKIKDTSDADVIERDIKNKLKVDDVELTWPEKLNVRFLWPKYRANPQKFNGQYLLRWRTNFSSESFSRTLLLNSTVPFAEGMPLPHDRFLVINWDLGGVFSGRRGRNSSDFSCGLAGMFELSSKRLFLYDCVLEVFSSSTEAAATIAKFYQRQMKIGKVGVCRIEDANGARNLEGEINAIAKSINVPLQIFWDLPDNTANSKNINIAMLCGAMKKGLIQFSSNIPYRDEMYKEFERWLPVGGKHRKDDGPDCAAQIWRSFSNQIFPNQVMTLQPSGNEYAYEFETVAPEVDPHADEKENADWSLLQRMTVPHS